MEETWAWPAIQWLLTPTLITGAVIALMRLYDPPTRWTRRLKSDMAILGGLPEGAEKRVWQRSVEGQATRLREYQRAFTGRTLVIKWLAVAGVSVAVFGLVLFPPINDPGEPADFGPADYMMVGMGGFASLVYVSLVSSGRDMFGRTPRQLLLIRRLKQYDRRVKKLDRLDKERAKRHAAGMNIKLEGSRLGFSTQIDEFGPWMRDLNLREYVRNAGIVSADFRAEEYATLRRRGVPFPAWPDPDSRRSAEPPPHE